MFQHFMGALHVQRHMVDLLVLIALKEMNKLTVDSQEFNLNA